MWAVPHSKKAVAYNAFLFRHSASLTSSAMAGPIIRGDNIAGQLPNLMAHIGKRVLVAVGKYGVDTAQMQQSLRGRGPRDIKLLLQQYLLITLPQAQDQMDARLRRAVDNMMVELDGVYNARRGSYYRNIKVTVEWLNNLMLLLEGGTPIPPGPEETPFPSEEAPVQDPVPDVPMMDEKAKAIETLEKADNFVDTAANLLNRPVKGKLPEGLKEEVKRGILDKVRTADDWMGMLGEELDKLEKTGAASGDVVMKDRDPELQRIFDAKDRYGEAVKVLGRPDKGVKKPIEDAELIEVEKADDWKKALNDVLDFMEKNKEKEDTKSFRQKLLRIAAGAAVGLGALALGKDYMERQRQQRKETATDEAVAQVQAKTLGYIPYVEPPGQESEATPPGQATTRSEMDSPLYMTPEQIRTSPLTPANTITSITTGNRTATSLPNTVEHLDIIETPVRDPYGIEGEDAPMYSNSMVMYNQLIPYFIHRSDKIEPAFITFVREAYEYAMKKDWTVIKPEHKDELLQLMQGTRNRERISAYVDWLMAIAELRENSDAVMTRSRVREELRQTARNLESAFDEASTSEAGVELGTVGRKLKRLGVPEDIVKQIAPKNSKRSTVKKRYMELTERPPDEKAKVLEYLN